MIITCGLIISTWTFPPPVGLVTPYLRRIQSKARCILSVSVHVEPLLICSLTADLWQSQRDHRPTLCSGGVVGGLAILALENRIGSQPLWLCQEGVGGDLCYMLPSIREHITSPWGEREGHGAISRERCWLFLPRLKERRSLSASCLLRVMRAGFRVSDSLHALRCLQAGRLVWVG